MSAHAKEYEPNGARPTDWGPEEAANANGSPATTSTPKRIGELFAESLVRVERRCGGTEKPIKLPWPVLADHFGGGLWPGLHILNAGTGVGKTQAALQAAVFAAKSGVPVLYLGLELGELDLALRVLGEEAHVPWSYLWTGKAGPDHVRRVHAAAPILQDLPFHLEVARPHGFPPSAIRSAVEAMRVVYPETNGPGSRPLLVVVDFLQLVGDEPEQNHDLRIRIGRASYVLRELANRLSLAVFCISSIARERYKISEDIVGTAGLKWELDENEYPVKRRILNTDAIVGAGKESGDIEYAADSVSVVVRVPATWDDTGFDVVFATAKGRATGATWSPLHFTGFRYEECPDQGGRMIEAWAAASEKKDRAREEKKNKKDEKKVDDIRKDADAIRTYVAANPGCSVTRARIETVNDNSRRWSPAVELLGEDLIQTPVGKQKKALSLRDKVST